MVLLLHERFALERERTEPPLDPGDRALSSMAARVTQWVKLTTADATAGVPSLKWPRLGVVGLSLDDGGDACARRTAAVGLGLGLKITASVRSCRSIAPPGMPAHSPLSKEAV